MSPISRQTRQLFESVVLTSPDTAVFVIRQQRRQLGSSAESSYKNDVSRSFVAGQFI